ncbi:cytochrome P450 [Mycena filopes]|nr:cytochrome P450 [Mycena filopes]
MPDLVPLISAIFLSYLLVYLARALYGYLTVPLRLQDLPGPRNPTFLYGHYKQMAGDPTTTDKWRAAFGRTFQFGGLFNIRELHTSDPKAVARIVSNLPIYTKTPATRYNLTRLWGDGKNVHTRSSPHTGPHSPQISGFSAKSMRLFNPIFVRHSNHLRDLWCAEFSESTEPKRIDVLSWLRRAALDSMGDTGLNYQFNSLVGGEPSELMKALSQLLHTSGSKSTFITRIAQASFPMLRYLVGHIYITGPRETLLKIGAEILAERKAAVLAAGDGEPPADMMSCMIISNNALPAHQRLSDDVLIAQVPTLIVVGHENTRQYLSAAAAWALWMLAVHQDMQEKLRTELFTIESDTPTYDELNSLPYLEAIIKETMRLGPSVEFTSRVTAVDDILPLSEPVVDRKGRVHSSIPVPKGQKVHIPIRALNIDKALWGQDADEFKPERWDKLPETVSAIPSLYNHLFSFYAGPHGCIGYRYAVIEQKAFLFSLVRAFEFHNAVPPETIGRTSGTSLSRPLVLSEREKGTQLPLMVNPYRKN